jgi:orotate phosphoribosyltransferase
MSNFEEARAVLLALLKRKSVSFGDFTLSSGAKSTYYIDCRLTTFDPEGAWLVGRTLHTLIRKEQAARKLTLKAVGGLTMGADPVAMAVGMYSHHAKDAPPLQVFSVRKSPKSHGQARLIEGSFNKGDAVVVVDDVITRGDSTIAAIKAVENEGGSVALVVVLVDRQQGGREKIEALGHPVLALFTKNDLLGSRE